MLFTLLEKDALYGVNPNLATYYKRNIPYIDFYSISDGAREYFIYSPTDPEVVERLKGQGITDYVLTEMRGTRMVKLEDINFTKVKDKEILAIDFTNTVTKIQVKKGDNIGFITEDGRKGIMNIVGASGRYIDFKCKTQTIPQ